MSALGLITPIDGNAQSTKATWTAPRLELTASIGTSQSVPAEVTPGSDVQDASLWVVPELAGLLSFPAGCPSTLRAGVPVPLVAVVDIPGATAEGVYEGTVHVRSGRGTAPAILKVALSVRAPLPTLVPQDVAMPSQDRKTVGGDASLVVRDELLVMVDFGVVQPDDVAVDIATSTNGVLIGALPDARFYQIRFPDVRTLEELEILREGVSAMPGVSAAVLHDFTVRDHADSKVPDDPEYAEWWDDLYKGNWHLRFIRAPEAWALTTGSRDVKLAVIDRVFDRVHPDLKPNVVLPVRQLTQYPGPSDSLPASQFDATWDHGNHVAGIACAKGNNSKGVAGVAWDCGLSLYDVAGTQGGVSSIVDAFRAMKMAVDDGAKVVNMSFGNGRACGASGCQPPTPEELSRLEEGKQVFRWAIEYGRRNGDVLWVASAGNSAEDAKYNAPGSLSTEFANVLTVAAVGLAPLAATKAPLLASSNWGTTVNVAAPGRGVHSTLRPRHCSLLGCSDQESYGAASDPWGGTSFAAPQVAGVAVLVKSNHPDYTAAQIRSCIVNAKGPSVTGQPFSVVDAAAAVECRPQEPGTYYTFTGTVSSAFDSNSSQWVSTLGGFTVGVSTVKWTFMIDTAREGFYWFDGTFNGPYGPPYFYSQLYSGESLAVTGADPAHRTNVTFGYNGTTTSRYVYGSKFPGMNPNYVIVNFGQNALADLHVGQSGFWNMNDVDDRYGPGASGLHGQLYVGNLTLTRISATPPAAVP
jgi:subtilisin family serine protease